MWQLGLIICDCVFTSRPTVLGASDTQWRLCVMSVFPTEVDQFYTRRPIRLYDLSYFVLCSVKS